MEISFRHKPMIDQPMVSWVSQKSKILFNGNSRILKLLGSVRNAANLRFIKNILFEKCGLMGRLLRYVLHMLRLTYA